MKKILLVLLAFASFIFASAIISPKNVHAAPGCGFAPTSVAVGDSLGIIITDLPGINVARLYPFGGLTITLGNIDGGSGGAGGNTFTIPTSATSPAYQVRVQTPFIGEITCAGGNLTITNPPPPPPPSGTYTVWAIVPGCTSGLTCFKGVATGVTGTTYTFNSSNSTITKNTDYTVTVCSGDCATSPPLAGWPKTCQASDFTTLVVDWGNNTCTGPGTVSTYTAVVNTAGCTGSLSCVVQTSATLFVTSYDFNGLTANTAYDVYICTPNCSTDPLKPGWDPKPCTSDNSGTLALDWTANTCGSNVFTGTGGADCESFFDCLTNIDSPTTKFDENGLVGAIFSSILPIIIGLGGFLTVIIIVISGIQFIASNGNPEGAAAARGRLTFAIIGLALLILAYAITQIVDNVFLRGSGIF